MAEASGQGNDAKKPNIIKRLWQKSGLTFFLILLACKGGLPPTLAQAAYEAHDWAEIYTTLGYLVAIISHLSLAIQPRAKFLQSLIVSLVFSCMGAAVALLEIRCVVSARGPPPTAARTGGSGSPELPLYSAAACATAAAFFFFFIFLANCLKAARPHMMLPMVQFVIFVTIASVYAPSFPTMAVGMSFVRRILITFLTGYAVGAGVSLFILPVTSRASVTKQLAGFTKLMKACIASHGAYMAAVYNAVDAKGEATEAEMKAAKTLKGTMLKTTELLGKIKLEIGFARKELAFGKLSPHHFSEIYGLMRRIFQPVLGMTSFLEIVNALREHRAVFAENPEVREAMEAARKLESDEWDDVISISHEAYLGYQQTLYLGLQHVAYQLELEHRPKPKANADVEKTTFETPQPGDREFSQHLGSELHKYQRQRIEVIQEWATHKQLDLPKHFWRNVTDKPTLHRQTTTIIRERLNQHQLYMILYMNFLNFSVGKAILQLAQYADGLVADGTMSRRRIINPGFRRIRKLFMDALTKPDVDETLSAGVNGGSNVYLGDAVNKQKDPEHLPPANFYEKATDYLRQIPIFLQSSYASFGFRAAMATMSIGIIGYLEQTRPFFLEQRGVWALIMVAISMDPYAGQGIFGFVARIGGTALAMVFSIVIWYMCNHNHAGILVVFWLYISLWVLFILKFPQFAVVGIISSVTVVLIIGYELQVEVIGRRLATSNGQAFYPVQLLAVYRLAAVCAGLGTAFVWTYFPFPITTHGALRREVGNTLYTLANFYSIVHSTMDARLHLGPAIKVLMEKQHPVRQLDEVREKVFGKVLLMLNQLRTHGNFTRFEPTFGGKFPRQRYLELTNSVQNVFMYLALMVYSSRAFIDSSSDRDLLNEDGGGAAKSDGAVLTSNSTSNGTAALVPPAAAAADGDKKQDSAGLKHQRSDEDDTDDAWLTSFRAFVADNRQGITSHDVTKTLCLLSNALRNSQPLPPYLRAPRPFAQKWERQAYGAAAAAGANTEKRDEEEEALLGIEHFAHPAFAAFAVGEVASAFVTAELGKIVKIVKELVGEVDFSFHIHGSDGSAQSLGGVGGEDKEEKWWEALAGELDGGGGGKRKGD